MTSSHAGVRAGARVLRRLRSAVDPLTALPHRPDDAGGSGWLAVTVLRDPSEVDVGDLPAPLAELEDRIEVRVDTAPGDRGTELRARLREPSSGGLGQRLGGADPQADLRSALRRAKQLLEVGEVLRVDPAPHGERPSTPGGLLLEAWTRAAPRAGVR